MAGRYGTRDAQGRRVMLARILRPSGARAFASAALAIALGSGGMFVYIRYVTLDQTSPLLPRIVGYLLCWPVIVIGHMANGPGPISNFDPILIGKFGWLALWIYYYVLVSIGAGVWQWRKERNRRTGPWP
jgi:hypothetical protein